GADVSLPGPRPSRSRRDKRLRYSWSTLQSGWAPLDKSSPSARATKNSAVEREEQESGASQEVSSWYFKRPYLNDSQKFLGPLGQEFFEFIEVFSLPF